MFQAVAIAMIDWEFVVVGYFSCEGPRCLRYHDAASGTYPILWDRAGC